MSKDDAATPQWHFHVEPSGVAYGNDASLFHFQGQGNAGWVRELMQNSLDARLEFDQPVEIRLSQEELAAGDVDLTGLLATINRCLDRPNWTGKAEGLLRQALRNHSHLDAVSALRYEERNTRGARIEDGTWEALTRAEGISGGKDGAAMGVYGIGKNAVYTASPLHAVVYVTRYMTDDMRVVQRMIGRASLSSHEDDDGRRRQPKGWLGVDEGKDLEGKWIPPALRRKETGTTIHILGSQDLDVVVHEYLAETAAHYFPAIHYGHLTVESGNHYLATSTLREYFDLKRGVKGPRALRGLNALSEGERAEKHIPGVGNVRLNLKVEEEGERSVIFLVRGSGLVITRNLTAMGDACPAVDNGRCTPYTAVVHVLDTKQGDKGWVRQCENPAHDQVSVANVLDREDKREARKALRELAGWVKDQIEGMATRPTGPDQRNATELAHYLPTPDLFQDAEESGDSGEGERFAFSAPRRINTSSKPLPTQTDPESGRVAIDREGEDQPGSEESRTTERENGNRGNGSASVQSGQRTIRMTYKCNRTRILPIEQNQPHRLRITFDVPTAESPEMRLCTIGEDGGYEQTTISAVSLLTSRDSEHPDEAVEILDDRKGFRLARALQGKRLAVEIGLLEPSHGQAYDLVWREASEGAGT